MSSIAPSGTPCWESPPPTRKYILFLNKNISQIRDYMNVYTERIVSTTVWTLQVKKYHNFFILLSEIAEIQV